MPYIKNRSFEGLSEIAPGNLNYMLTKVCQAYLEQTKGNYQAYNDVIGALECCKLELYRRLIVPYEDQKIIENGDVYA